MTPGDRGHDRPARIRVELADARELAHRIAAALEIEAWGTRPAPAQWSVGECLIHLNMTSRAFLPLIKDALGTARDRDPSRRTPYRMDFVGRLVWWAATLRLPVKTTEPFVPARSGAKDTVLSEFDALQSQLFRPSTPYQIQPLLVSPADPGPSAAAPDAGAAGHPEASSGKERRLIPDREAA